LSSRMTLELLLKTTSSEISVPMHSKNWRKGNIVLMTNLIAKRVIKYAVVNEKPGNGFGGYYEELIKFQKEPKGLPCYRCRELITIGSRCFSKHRGRNTRSYYHMGCAIQVNLIEELEVPAVNA
jgi:hypothetical protein